MIKTFITSLQGRAKYSQSADRKGGRHLAIYLLSLSLLLTPGFNAQVKAYTTQSPVNQSDNELQQIPWEQTLKEYTTQNGAVDPNFSKDDPNLSIVMWTVQAGTTPDWHDWDIKFAYRKDGQQLKMSRAQWGTSGNYVFRVDNGTHHGTIYTPLSLSAAKTQNNWTNVCTSLSRPSNCEQGFTSNVTLQSGVYFTNVFGQGAINGFIYVKNVNYDASWDGAKDYNSNIKSGIKESECSTLNVGCWIARAFNGVENTMSSIGQAALRGISYLFIPQEKDIISPFTTLKTRFTEKLGFLAYPIVFLNDALTAPTSFACSSSSCVKNYGAFFNSNLNYDFAALPHNFPTVWAVVRTLTISIVSLGIILLLYRKIVQILDGDDHE